MSYDLTFLEIGDEQALLQTHGGDKCEGRPCCIHHPSDHRMNTWPLRWVSSVYLMERVCPHGIGHPDPDHLAFVATLRFGSSGAHTVSVLDAAPTLADYQAEHTCDGCCEEPE